MHVFPISTKKGVDIANLSNTLGVTIPVTPSHQEISFLFSCPPQSNLGSWTTFLVLHLPPPLGDEPSRRCFLYPVWSRQPTRASHLRWDRKALTRQLEWNPHLRDQSQYGVEVSFRESNIHSPKSNPRRGKLTIVGFFSSTKAFLVKRLKWRMMYWGKCWHLKRRSCPTDSWRPVSTPHGLI